MILLHELVPEDMRRLTPLGDMNAFIRNKNVKRWRPISAFKIRDNTYNEVAEGWAEHNEFAIPYEFHHQFDNDPFFRAWVESKMAEAVQQYKREQQNYST